MGSYRPSYSPDGQPPHKKRHRDAIDSSRQNSRTSKRRKRDTHSPAPQSKPPTVHTKRERTTNPSTRIHSLRNLLARDVLPPEQRRDKERELSSLLFDQEKDRAAKTMSQMIQRYHMVRFFERKKAERKLKKLQKQKEEVQRAIAGDDGATEPSLQKLTATEKTDRDNLLKDLVHEAEVDVSYTIFSPLGEKYIAIFPNEKSETGKKRKKRKNTKYKTSEQKSQLEAEAQENSQMRDEDANLAKVSILGTKPPLWYEVEKCMEGDDEDAVKKKLQALRDRKPASLEGLGLRSSREVGKGVGQKRKPDRLDEDGHIDPADLDSAADENVKIADVDEDESDGGWLEE